MKHSILTPFGGMGASYLKIAFRNLIRNKVYTIINIGGLSIGLACVLLISLYVKNELSFDDFQKNKKQIYRIVQTSLNKEGEERKTGNTGMIQAPTFAREIPEVESFCRIKGWRMLVKNKNEIESQLVIYTDPSFFEIYSFKMLQGNSKQALTDKNSVIISQNIALKYFNTLDVLNKDIEIDQEGVFQRFKVAGVVENAPLNSSIQFDFLLPISLTDREGMNTDWLSSYQNSFVLLSPESNPKTVEAKMHKVFMQHYGNDLKENLKKYGGTGPIYQLQSFEKIHSDKEYFASNGLQNWNNTNYVTILTSIAIFILILACINYVNLTLARSFRRSKEIGIRKAVGGTRKQLIIQFVYEAILLTFLALFPSILILHAILPSFCQLTNTQPEAYYLLDYQIIVECFLIVVFIALLAGLYPALILSGFGPIQTLTGKFKLAGKNYWGKSLIVVQFAVALVLVNGTFILQKQFDFLTSKPLGYDPENILSFYIPSNKAAQLVPIFKEKIEKLPYVQQVTSTNWGFNKTSFEIESKPTDWIYYQEIDENYLSLFNIPLIHGRKLSYGYPADSLSNCMINEVFAQKYGWKQPLGKTINWRGKKYSVVGVTSNYHNASLHENIEPIFLYMDGHKYSNEIFVKIPDSQIPNVTSAIRQIYKGLVPYVPFESSRYEDQLIEKYKSEQTWKNIILWASVIAIFIAFLGLFGLATLVAEQRVKEVGIRKVLGANIFQISILLIKDFLILVFLAFIPAIPAAWYYGKDWLNNFAYHFDLNWSIFGVSAILVLILSFLTVGLQAIKAALMNPVKSLKTE